MASGEEISVLTSQMASVLQRLDRIEDHHESLVSNLQSVQISLARIEESLKSVHTPDSCPNREVTLRNTQALKELSRELTLLKEQRQLLVGAVSGTR